MLGEKLSRAMDNHLSAVFAPTRCEDASKKPSYAWQSDWNLLVEDVLKKALVLQAKLKVSPERYVYLWAKNGETFDASRMIAKRFYPHGSSDGNEGPITVAFPLVPGVMMLPFQGRPADILAKTHVLVMR